MLADIAQKGQHIQALRPVQVVDEHGRGRARVEIDKPRDLSAQLIHPPRHHIGRIELALLSLEAGIANQTRSAAYHNDGPMPGQLKTTQHQQRHQGADVQAVRRGVETAIE